MRHTFPLLEIYRALNDKQTLKRFAIAYMQRNFPNWKPVQIISNKVLAEYIGLGEKG
ncbi:hypothetical protein [Brevibacillus sp. 7WMA2]|uniref:hypothetical protein n=1 Tax=Brevibacillus sp. 7WMA2 TaxID=2683193 RepID=UPI0015775E67|nr:hypothetical protein [Brevibacillus sp. 7WMA2]